MANLATEPVVNVKENLLPSSEESHSEGWEPSAIVTDIATLATGTLLAGIFNVALVFVIPKLLSVEDYGYWRMFALYASYVGFLHFGFADGALLRWAGRSLEEFHHEIAPAMKYLSWQHLLILAPVCVIAAYVCRGPLRFVAIALAIYAPLFNLTATLQFGLQGARIFRPVALSTIAPPALLLLLSLLWASRWHSQFREIILLFIVTWCVPLAFLLAWVEPWSGHRDKLPIKQLAHGCLLNGWPILMTNTGFSLILYADRLAVSWGASIQDFAQYSMAASAMAVPITAVQACSKVLFSHVAAVTVDSRKRIYGLACWGLLITWTVSLPYYFALDWFVRHYLPRYAPSVGFSRILLLGIPFMAVIQIVQMSYAYLTGLQKRFLARTIAVLTVSVGVTSFAVFHLGSLRVVAGLQVAILGAWWLLNEITLQQWTAQNTGEWVRFAAVYLMSSAVYWLASGIGGHVAAAVALYYVAVGVVLGLSCPDKLGLLLNELRAKSGGATLTAINAE